MKAVGRLSLLVLAGVAALALSASAFAAYTTPRLAITNPSDQLGGGSSITINVSQSRADDATFRLVIYAPQGYVSSIANPAGVQLGTVTATAQGNAISADTILPLTGTVVSADPEPYRSAPAAIGCTTGIGGTTFDTVWILRLTTAGQTLEVPMYVYAVTAGPEADFASVKMVACLPSPYIPPASGGAAFGAKLLTASIKLNRIFTNPNTAGAYRWRAIWTPWTVGGATPNAAGTVETQALDSLPAQLTLAAKLNTAKKQLTFTGRLLENRLSMGGATIRLMVGTTARNVKRVATVRTNAAGRFTKTIRFTRSGRVFVRARVIYPTRTVAGCTEPTNPAVPCLRTTRSGFHVYNLRALRIR